MESLATAIKRRGVTQFVHFTPMLNLVEVIRRGEIASHSRVREWSAVDSDFRDVVRINDKNRFDGRPDHINLSVQKPNSWFLRTCKIRRNVEEHTIGSWYLIAIKPECCLSDGVLFTVGNAASTYVRSKGTKGGVEGFEAMFAQEIKVSRGGSIYTEHRSQTIPANIPTSVQAEVLVPHDIPVSMIKCVYAESKAEAMRLQVTLACQGIEMPCDIEVDNSVF